MPQSCYGDRSLRRNDKSLIPLSDNTNQPADINSLTLTFDTWFDVNDQRRLTASWLIEAASWLVGEVSGYHRCNRCETKSFSLSAKPFNSASKQTTCKSTKLLEYLLFFLLTMPLAYERRENKKEHMSRMRQNTAILVCHLVSVLRQKTSLRSWNTKRTLHLLSF